MVNRKDYRVRGRFACSKSTSCRDRGAMTIEYAIGLAFLLTLALGSLFTLDRLMRQRGNISASVSVSATGKRGAIDRKYYVAPCLPNGSGQFDENLGECF